MTTTANSFDERSNLLRSLSGPSRSKPSRWAPSFSALLNLCSNVKDIFVSTEAEKHKKTQENARWHGSGALRR